MGSLNFAMKAKKPSTSGFFPNDLYKQLKENPVAFRQAADRSRNRGMGIPSQFWESLSAEEKAQSEAISVMAALHAKPSNWQWAAKDLEDFIGISARAVNRGVSTLKKLGWIGHVNVYIEGEILATYILTFDQQLEDADRKGRFSLCSHSGNWMLRTPRKKRIAVKSPRWMQGSESDFMCERRVHRHNISSKEYSSQTLLRRAQEDPSLPAAPEEVSTSKCHLIPEEAEESGLKSDDFRYRPPREKPENQITLDSRTEEQIQNDRELVQELEHLGRKRDDSDSFDNKLEYEEFVNEKILPRLLPPSATSKSRKKIWNLQWAQEQMWGLLFLQLSRPGESWNLNQARRLIRRIEEGYINPRQMRVVLYFFDWRRHKKPIEDWTFRGKKKKENGTFDFVDEWKDKVDSSFRSFRHEGPMCAGYDRNQLYPDEDQMLSCDIPTVDRILDAKNRHISNRREGSVEEIGFYRDSIRSDDVLGFLLAPPNCPLPKKAMKLIEAEKETLIQWLATARAGVILWEKQGHTFHTALGADFGDRVVAKHRQFVKQLRRRLKIYDLSDEGVIELL